MADPSPPMDASLETLERLRALRGRPERDLGIGGLVARFQRDSRRLQRDLGPLVDAWEAVVPPPLAERTRLDSIRGGVLRVVASSSAVVYEVDRHLREGALAQLRAHSRVAVSRVRLTVGAVEPDGGTAGRTRGDAPQR